MEVNWIWAHILHPSERVCLRSQKEGGLLVWCVIHKISSAFLFTPPPFFFLLVHCIVTSLLLTPEKSYPFSPAIFLEHHN